MFNGTTTTHTYGSDGLRRRTVKGADTTDYILDGDSVIRTLENGVLDKTYFHGLRGPEYERTGAGNPTWYVYDGLGSVVGLLDVNGSLVSTRKYDVYGSVRGGTGISGSKHKFVGSLGHPSEDDAGLIYMRARWMGPTTGTFASEDPARDGANWYAYCRSQPITNGDPNGKSAWLIAMLDQALALAGITAPGTLRAIAKLGPLQRAALVRFLATKLDLEGEAEAVLGALAHYDSALEINALEGVGIPSVFGSTADEARRKIEEIASAELAKRGIKKRISAAILRKVVEWMDFF